MVTHISGDTRPSPTEPRGLALLRTPYVATVAVLTVLVIAVWATILLRDDGPAQNVACPAPANPRGQFSPQPSDALDTVSPARLSQTRFRVLNANGQSGQAGAVAAQLSELGFTSVGESAVGNDPVYPGQDLACHGQIRFGEAGRSAARSLSVAAPCMELVADGRKDATVDLVLGQTFAQLTRSNVALGTLDRLKTGSPPDEAQLRQARSVSC